MLACVVRYTLVGLEQTAESVRLPDYRWPSKVVLVLGREKEGIPPEVRGRWERGGKERKGSPLSPVGRTNP